LLSWQVLVFFGGGGEVGSNTYYVHQRVYTLISNMINIDTLKKLLNFLKNKKGIHYPTHDNCCTMQNT